MADVDRFNAICVLFLRALQRDLTEAPKVVVSPAKGALWVAAVFIGEPPRELLAHYQRGAVEGQAMQRAPTLTEAHRIATGNSGEEAVQALFDGLVATLHTRLESDLATWERAMGVPFARPRSTPSPRPGDEVPQPNVPLMVRRSP